MSIRPRYIVLLRHHTFDNFLAGGLGFICSRNFQQLRHNYSGAAFSFSPMRTDMRAILGRTFTRGLFNVLDFLLVAFLVPPVVSIAVVQEPPFVLPIHEVPPGKSRVYRLPGHRCSTGEDYLYALTRGENATDFSKLHIDFMGGGACFDYKTCSGNGPPEVGFLSSMGTQGELLVAAGLLSATEKSCVLSSIGFLPCSSPAFAAYTTLSITYCSGDVHTGNNVTTYFRPAVLTNSSGEVVVDDTTETGLSNAALLEAEFPSNITIRHTGAATAEFLIRSWVHTFKNKPKITDVVLAGGSAGGWGAMLWAGRAMELLDAARRQQGVGNSSLPHYRVFIDSAFHAPIGSSLVMAVQHGVRWNVPNSLLTWRGATVSAENAHPMLENWISAYGDRFQVGFFACDQDANAQGFSDYMLAAFGGGSSGGGTTSNYNRTTAQWAFLSTVHERADALNSVSVGGGGGISLSNGGASSSTSSVFSYVLDGKCHHLTRARKYYPRRMANNSLVGALDAELPVLRDWVGALDAELPVLRDWVGDSGASIFI